MSYLSRPLGAAIVLSTGISVAARGRGMADDAPTPAVAASTLLDDGLPMRSHPAAVPPGSDTRALARHGTAACCWSAATAPPRRDASGLERVRVVSP
jgi:hypothetical protein